MREYDDLKDDTETEHKIESVRFPSNHGQYLLNQTDLVLFVLLDSINNCAQEQQERCWTIQPAKIADTYTEIPQGAEVRTIGWGATEYSPSQSQFPLEITLKVATSTHLHYFIQTKVGPNGEDTCKGDSGGPLLIQDKDYNDVVVATLHIGCVTDIKI